MNEDILNQLNQIRYFTIESYMQLSDLYETEKVKARSQLSRAVHSGQIIRLKRGVYLTADFYRTYHNDPRFNPTISQIINPFSYVSSVYILQQENIIPEATFLVTAVTTKNTMNIENQIDTFTYQHIRESLYLGFTSNEFLGLPYYTATPAKALFDYLYLKTIPRALRKQEISISSELRLNINEFTETQKEEFSLYVSNSHSEKMLMIYQNLEKHQWQH